MKYGTFLHVAREAWWLLLPLILIGVILSMSLNSAVPWMIAGLLSVGLALGFRDHDRLVPVQALGLVVPVDGTIVHRRECHDPYLDRAAIRISIAVNRSGVYYFRAPCEGTLMEIRGGHRGERHTAQASWIRTDEFDDIIMVVSEGSLLGQRPCGADFGKRLGQGRRCGVRRLARRVELYIPVNSRVDVEMQQKVRAGNDVLATMVHNATNLDVVSS